MRFIAFVLAIVAAIASSQAPEFAQQYRQRLGGAIDELARIINTFDTNSAATGTDRAGGLALMARDNEPLVRAQAVSMAETIIRYERLTEQQAKLENSAPFARLAAFYEDYDQPLMESTFRNFEPAVPATAEGILFAAGGFVAIYFLLRILGAVFRPRRRHRLQRTA